MELNAKPENQNLKNVYFASEIKKLKVQNDAVILAHYYQIPEIQDIADFIGDSLALSQFAQKTKASVIVFAGVHFMAETAKILNPDKKVLIPDMEAGCSLADSCKADKFKEFCANYPGHKIVSYINCSAEIKSMSNVICTSGNAVKIVESIPKNEKIIFAPDKNLGAYINSVTGRNMILWNGTCEIHDVLTTESIIKLKTLHPDAKLIAHPECRSVILEMADFIGSTTAMLKYTQSDISKKYIVATETGILHQMKKVSPDKEFIIVPAEENCSCNDCSYMKLNTMEKLYLCMKTEKPEIILDKEIIEKAKTPILKMLEISA
jgi:quinolinate synthase